MVLSNTSSKFPPPPKVVAKRVITYGSRNGGVFLGTRHRSRMVVWERNQVAEIGAYGSHAIGAQPILPKGGSVGT